jgi:hypothetical protein
VTLKTPYQKIVEAAAQAAISTLLPEKSKQLYESAYKKFHESSPLELLGDE